MCNVYPNKEKGLHADVEIIPLFVQFLQVKR